MSKQTAVEWLISKLQWSKADYENQKSEVDQAKEMERQNIIDAANWDSKSIAENGVRMGEKYFNQTFKD